jgi:amidohydrolase
MNIGILRKFAEDMKPWLVNVRNDLHMHPELGGNEIRTSAMVIKCLKEMGIECHAMVGSTAVIGLIRGKYSGRTIAIRADMDALPIQEENDAPYRSLNDGVMHACGHDAHMAILLGTARLFTRIRDNLHGNIKLLFQPAEETTGGAENMVNLGCMRNPDVDYCIGLHVTAAQSVGKVEIKYGAMNGSSDIIHFKVQGKKAHGAYPDLGTDAIVIAAQTITALQSFVSRNVSPLDSAVLTIGSIHGGVRANIIADEVNMESTLRTINPLTRQFAKDRIGHIVKGVSDAMGGSAEVSIQESYKVLINTSSVVDVVKKAAQELLGSENVIIRDKPSLGVEDFSYFLDAAPGAFYHLGCANANKGITSTAHTSTFDIDEDCLPLGVLLHACVALHLLENQDSATKSS